MMLVKVKKYIHLLQFSYVPSYCKRNVYKFKFEKCSEGKKTFLCNRQYCFIQIHTNTNKTIKLLQIVCSGETIKVYTLYVGAMCV